MSKEPRDLWDDNAFGDRWSDDETTASTYRDSYRSEGRTFLDEALEEAILREALEDDIAVADDSVKTLESLPEEEYESVGLVRTLASLPEEPELEDESDDEHVGGAMLVRSLEGLPNELDEDASADEGNEEEEEEDDDQSRTDPPTLSFHSVPSSSSQQTNASRESSSNSSRFSKRLALDAVASARQLMGSVARALTQTTDLGSVESPSRTRRSTPRASPQRAYKGLRNIVGRRHTVLTEIWSPDGTEPESAQQEALLEELSSRPTLREAWMPVIP